MSDDDAVGGESLARTFDYLKHLTTVALVAIGGVLGLLKGEGPTLKPVLVVLVVALLALGGVVSMMTLSALSNLEIKRDQVHAAKVGRALPWAQSVATFAVMLGLGTFLGGFVGVITQ